MDSATFVWLPIMDGNQSKKWLNQLVDEGNTIIETYLASSEGYPEDRLTQERYTFGRYENGYRFLGIFRRDAIRSTPQRRVYHRVAEELDLRMYGTEKEKSNLEIVEKETNLQSISLGELGKKAVAHSGAASAKQSKTGMIYLRSPEVAIYTKRRAHGQCQLCGKTASFLDKHGEPFLECHHIKWISEGGADSPENTVALCPNCHRKMHVLNDQDDVKNCIKQLLSVRAHFQSD